MTILHIFHDESWRGKKKKKEPHEEIVLGITPKKGHWGRRI